LISRSSVRSLLSERIFLKFDFFLPREIQNELETNLNFLIFFLDTYGQHTFTERVFFLEGEDERRLDGFHRSWANSKCVLCVCGGVRWVFLKIKREKGIDGRRGGYTENKKSGWRSPRDRLTTESPTSIIYRRSAFTALPYGPAKKGVGLILLLDGLVVVVVWLFCFLSLPGWALFLSLQPLQPPP
jgi:hypothetical protein